MSLTRLLKHATLAVLGMAVAFLLVVIEHQDKTLKLQGEAVEFYRWSAHLPIQKDAVVVKAIAPRCYELRFDDAFPIGYGVVVCGDFPKFENGTKLTAYIRDSEVVGVSN